MHDLVKNLRSNDQIKGRLPQKPGCGKTVKDVVMIMAKDLAMKRRIQELEVEIENLRSTVKFYQDIYLREE